jgi:hypothetical protein
LKVERLPIKEGEATANPPAQSPCTLCPERGPKKATGKHPFCWKKGSQGGRTSQGFTLVYRFPKNAKTPPLEKSPDPPPKKNERCGQKLAEKQVPTTSRIIFVIQSHSLRVCQLSLLFVITSHGFGVGHHTPTNSLCYHAQIIMDKFFFCASGTRGSVC